MQYDSFLELFDTVEMTPERPAHPIGELFTYYPSFEPEALHYHNFLELGYCEEGSGIFIVDGNVIPFSGRCASIIYEGQRHIAQSIRPENSLWHFLYVDPGKLFSGSGLLNPELARTMHYRNYNFRNILSYNEAPELYDIIRLIMQETAGNAPDMQPALQGLVYALLKMHGRHMDRKPVDTADRYSQDLEDISAALNYINMHYIEKVEMQTLLRVCSMSKASLQRKFLNVTGLSPMQYLHHLRIKHATVMLQDRGHSVLQIAMTVGYNSLSSFNRTFLKVVGMPPSQWRKSFGVRRQ